MSRNSDVHVACTNAMVFGMWKWHEEGQNAQHQHEYTYDQQDFHGLPPRLDLTHNFGAPPRPERPRHYLGRNP